MGTHTPAGQVFNRTSFDDLLKRRMFFTEAFEVYRTAPNFKGDNRGLYDYGPPGCGLQANIVDIWRKHFVLEEDMLELVGPESKLMHRCQFCQADSLRRSGLQRLDTGGCL